MCTHVVHEASHTYTYVHDICGTYMYVGIVACTHMYSSVFLKIEGVVTLTVVVTCRRYVDSLKHFLSQMAVLQ